MEMTYKDDGRDVRSDARSFNNDAGDAAQKVRDAGGQEVRNLLADVQDLVGRVAHVADPEIARLRTRIGAGLATTRKALADGTDQVQRQAKAAMATSDRYVHEQPWQSVGIAAVAGLLVGILVGRR
ncbi:MAG TPA: DUF883 family protein [Steroidobacteraceae bacterium]|jgi:ElaB/YqjD/DUF883 family membrane-anchored ribosome-binding protein|nr:DUF883 family protein [Steroidobacteraceae bacterium]